MFGSEAAAAEYVVQPVAGSRIMHSLCHVTFSAAHAQLLLRATTAVGLDQPVYIWLPRIPDRNDVAVLSTNPQSKSVYCNAATVQNSFYV